MEIKMAQYLLTKSDWNPQTYLFTKRNWIYSKNNSQTQTQGLSQAISFIIIIIISWQQQLRAFVYTTLKAITPPLHTRARDRNSARRRDALRKSSSLTRSARRRPREKALGGIIESSRDAIPATSAYAQAIAIYLNRGRSLSARRRVADNFASDFVVPTYFRETAICPARAAADAPLIAASAGPPRRWPPTTSERLSRGGPPARGSAYWPSTRERVSPCPSVSSSSAEEVPRGVIIRVRPLLSLGRENSRARDTRGAFKVDEPSLLVRTVVRLCRRSFQVRDFAGVSLVGGIFELEIIHCGAFKRYSFFHANFYLTLNFRITFVPARFFSTVRILSISKPCFCNESSHFTEARNPALLACSPRAFVIDKNAYMYTHIRFLRWRRYTYGHFLEIVRFIDPHISANIILSDHLMTGIRLDFNGMILLTTLKGKFTEQLKITACSHGRKQV